MPGQNEDHEASEATDWDMISLDKNPQWAQANHWKAKGRTRSWYVSVDPSCSGTVTDNTACHEFPFFSTQQGGPNQDPPTKLKQINASDNRFEGLVKLKSFYRAGAGGCYMASGTVPPGGTVAVGGDAFIIAPVGDSLPTTYV